MRTTIINSHFPKKAFPKKETDEQIQTFIDKVRKDNKLGKIRFDGRNKENYKKGEFFCYTHQLPFSKDIFVVKKGSGCPDCANDGRSRNIQKSLQYYQ